MCILMCKFECIFVYVHARKCALYVCVYVWQLRFAVMESWLVPLLSQFQCAIGTVTSCHLIVTWSHLLIRHESLETAKKDTAHRLSDSHI